MTQVPVYVLGVRDRFRGAALVEQLEAQGFLVHRVDAADGGQLGPTDLRRLTSRAGPRAIHGRLLTAAELAIFLSHLEIQRLIAQRQDPWALVLEDDAIADPWLMRVVPPLLGLGERPAVVQLGTMARPSLADRMHAFDGGVLRALRHPANGTFGYAINRACAAAAVQASQGRRVDSVADWPLRWPRHVDFWITEPHLVTHPPLPVAAGASDAAGRPGASAMALRALQLPLRATGIRAAWYRLLGVPFRETFRRDWQRVGESVRYRMRSSGDERPRA